MLRNTRNFGKVLGTLFIGWSLLTAASAQAGRSPGAAPTQKPPAAGRVISSHTFSPFIVQEVHLGDQWALRVLRKENGQEQLVREIRREQIPYKRKNCDTCRPGSPGFLAFDPKLRKIYFQVAGAQGDNNPLDIFSMDLSKGKIVHLNDTYGSSISNGYLSPSGEYLAFLVATYLSGAEGFWRLEIVDTKKGKKVKLPPDREFKAKAENHVINVRRFNWLTGSRISFVQEVRERHPLEKPDTPVLSLWQRVFDLKKKKIVAEKDLKS